jgi:DNA polymerase I-like protein with 3'-5' exonuclease and polymerase domains
MTVAEATRVKAQYLSALPEIKELTKRVNDAGKNRSFITTLGGRQYYAQKPAVVKGVWKSFEYKLTNYLIQGSAADATKQAMLDYCLKTKRGELVLSVHDELVVQVNTAHSKAELLLLESCMNSSFQETLLYKVISTGSQGSNFSEASA